VVQKKKEILVSKLLFFMLIGSFGAFSNFINLYLEQVVGLTGSQIGFITFAGLMVTVVMNPIWGYVADKTGKHVLLLKGAFLSAVVMGALYGRSRHFLLIVIVSVLFEGLRAPIMPLLEYLSSNYCEKHRYDFGKVRVFASWGFLLVAMTTGFMVAGLQVEWLGQSFNFPSFLSLEVATFGIFIAMHALGFGLLFFLPKQGIDSNEKMAKNKHAFGRKDVRQLLKNRPFVFILLLTMIGFMGVESAFSYATMHLVTVLGASESIVSWVAFFMVAPELILLPFGTVLMRRVGFKKWYVLTLLTMMFRLSVYAFATMPLLFALGGGVHGIMIVMHVTGTVAYIRKVVPAHTLGLAFAMLASSMALSRAFLSFFFGWLYENINSFAVFRVAILLVFIAFVMAVKSEYLKEIGNEISAF